MSHANGGWREGSRPLACGESVCRLRLQTTGLRFISREKDCVTAASERRLERDACADDAGMTCCCAVEAPEKLMEKQTLDQLDAALVAVRKDLAPRVEELAQKSTAGVLTPEEYREYADVVRLNDMLSLLRLEAEELWTLRAAS